MSRNALCLIPAPATTNVHRDPLNNFNMAAASTGARTRTRFRYIAVSRLSRPNTPGHPASLASRCLQSPAAFSIRYVSRIKKTYFEASLKDAPIKRYVRITLIQKAKSTFAQNSAQ